MTISMRIHLVSSIAAYVVLLSGLSIHTYADSTINEEPIYLRDRGTGIATSMFGTYVRRRELIVYPYYEFYYDHNTEYTPADFGYSGDTEYEGKFVGHEGLLYIGYGFADWIMLELEAAYMYATFWKSDDDNSAMPSSLHEDGLGDVEGQLRWRYFKEREKIPEFFGVFEAVLPLQKHRKLIGTQAWEFKFGVGVIKGFRIGTFTGRFGVEYDGEEEEVVPGEYALEYLKRVSEHLRLFAMVEGVQDELELVLEGQIHFNEYVVLKLNTGIGITSAADDIAPETGVMFLVRFNGDKE